MARVRSVRVSRFSQFLGLTRVYFWGCEIRTKKKYNYFGGMLALFSRRKVELVRDFRLAATWGGFFWDPNVLFAGIWRGLD